MKTTFLLLALLAFALIFFQANTLTFVPITGLQGEWLDLDWGLVPSVNVEEDFSDSVEGLTSAVVRITFPEESSYSIVEQPQGQAGFVSGKPETLTHFRLAEKYGSKGYLAHNYLAGDDFFSLDVGDYLSVEDDGGHAMQYEIVAVKQYQALSPNSPYSNFIDLHTGDTLSASELFYEIYDVDDRLVLQTCIEREGVDTWGRIFVIAEPAPQKEVSAPAVVEPVMNPFWQDFLN